jgi:26S proteasome regulatory subunit T6
MATNRIDILDPALLRAYAVVFILLNCLAGPGRIDRKIEFPNPNELVQVAHIGAAPANVL